MNQAADIQDIIKKIKALDIEESDRKKKREKLLEDLESVATGGAPTPRRELQIGDRVKITSKVNRPARADTQWNRAKERRATIRRVEDDRVFLDKDNGTKTWRLKKHFQPL